MSGTCPVCGCKTEEIDFVVVDMGQSEEVSVCSYCSNQLGALKAADESDAESLVKIQPKIRWLDAVLAKEVGDRSEEFIKTLRKFRGRFPADLSENIAKTPDLPSGQGYAVAPRESREQSRGADAALLEELKERVSQLETDLSKFRRRLLITSVLEIVVPTVLLVVLALIFFKSDLWVSLSSLIYAATGGYNIY